MKIVVSHKISEFDYDTIVIPFFENNLQLEERGLDFLSGVITALFNKNNFSGKKDELLSFPYIFDTEIKNIVLAGAGKESLFSLEKSGHICGNILKLLKKNKSKNILFYPFLETADYIKKSAESFLLGDYSFNKYKSSEKSDFAISKIQIIADDSLLTEQELNELTILTDSVKTARDLVNEPANIMTPHKLALSVQELGEKFGFEVDVLDEEKIRTLKMDAFLAVAGGSANRPKLIVMRYHNSNNKDILGLVGKGLTYDSGGLSIKPTDSMLTMKSDMAGAAAVIGAVTAAARCGLKTNITGVIAACENFISSTSYRPGDIISTMAGKNIEIMNTDAEGRLTLADAVNYAIEIENVTSIIDIATLTGAALVALGTSVTAVISNNDNFCNFVMDNSKKAGEKTWRLPAYAEHRELIISDIADLKNTGGKYAGTITAGMFILEFAKELPLVHLDIAGTSWCDKALPLSPKGGTGEGVRTLFYCAKNFGLI